MDSEEEGRVRRAGALLGVALIIYIGALVAIYETPGGLLAAPEPLNLLLGGGIGVVLLLLLPIWW